MVEAHGDAMMLHLFVFSVFNPPHNLLFGHLLKAVIVSIRIPITVKVS